MPPIQRLAIALKHPLRVRILSALVAGDSSATRLSRQLGDVSVGDASYHLNVLADECRLIDRVKSRPVRGAVEHFFRLKPGVTLAVDPVTVDQRGMIEIENALQKAITRVKRAERGSQQRLGSSDSTAMGAAVAVAVIQTVIPSERRELGSGAADGIAGGFGTLRGAG
jgi:DNA-binding transcriptional ArsR family regulator